MENSIHGPVTDACEEMYHPQRGWYEGRYENSSAYEKSITLKTNAGVLEALLYKSNGKLYRANDDKEYRDVRFNSRFDHPGKCLMETFRWVNAIAG